jgi:hypothetical protein
MAKKKKPSKIKRLLRAVGKGILLGGAAYGASKLFGGRKKKFGTDAGFLKSEAAGGASLAADKPKNWITKKDVVPLKKPVVTKPADDSWLDVPPGVHGSGGKGDMWRRIKDAQYEKGEHYTPNLDPYKIPTPRVHKRMVNQGTTLRAKGGRIGAKKGGKVTGIAKRGFGRALGKK